MKTTTYFVIPFEPGHVQSFLANESGVQETYPKNDNRTIWPRKRIFGCSIDGSFEDALLLDPTGGGSWYRTVDDETTRPRKVKIAGTHSSGVDGLVNIPRLCKIDWRR